MTVKLVHIGIPNTPEGVKQARDQGFTVEPHRRGFHHASKSVIAHKQGATEPPTAGMCIALAEEVFGVSAIQILSHSRDEDSLRARFAAYWAARKIGKSYPQLERVFSKDHTTIISGVRRCEQMQETDPDYREACQYMWDMIHAQTESESP